MVYELNFSVGNIECMLVYVQPSNTPKERIGKYYEHYHSSFELHFVESGSATYICNKKSITLSAGELLIIPPRTYHKETSTSDSNSKMTLTLDISFPEKGAAPSDLHFCEAFRREGATKFHISEELRSEILKIRNLSTKKSGLHVDREKMRAHVHLFTVMLYEELSQISLNEAGMPADSTLMREFTIDTFLALNFMSNSAREDLAKELHVSPRQLHRIIRKSYGISYREKLSEIRLEIALSFLTSTTKSIREISDELGYSNPASFSTFIKKATGKTPIEIRRGI